MPRTGVRRGFWCFLHPSILESSVFSPQPCPGQEVGTTRFGMGGKGLTVHRGAQDGPVAPPSTFHSGTRSGSGSILISCMENNPLPVSVTALTHGAATPRQALCSGASPPPLIWARCPERGRWMWAGLGELPLSGQMRDLVPADFSWKTSMR